MSRGDVNVIQGINEIVNPQNIKQNIDIRELEERMISGGLISQKSKEPQDKLNDELSSMALELGISFGDTTKKQPDPQVIHSGQSTTPRNHFTTSTVGSGGFSSQSAGLATLYASQSGATQLPDYEESNSSSSSSSVDDNEYPGENTSGYNEEPEESPLKSNRFATSSNLGSNLYSRTREQERRSHIESVMGGSNNTDYSFEKEKREDVKCTMLADIDSLINSLLNEDIDLSRIPTVDKNSSYEDVEMVLKMLRHKNDHTRYCSFAEEFLLFGAYALEDLFDGKRMWFDRYRPNLTGWHNTVNTKLIRMRHDTGQIVSGVMQDYNIGPGMRILLELIPNMIIYSKQLSQQYPQQGLYSDEEMAKCAENLRR